MVALSVQLFVPDVTSIATTVSRISAVDATIVRTVVNQAVGVTNVTTAVTVLRQYATAVTVAPIVPQYVPIVTKNALTVRILIYAVAVTPAWIV